MRWNPGSTLVCLALALALAEPLAGQDWVGRGRAHGQVVDEQGDPVADATVTLHLPGRPDAGPEPEVTGKDGRWAFGGLLGGKWTVVIEHDGYMTSEGSFAVNEFAPAQPLRVELQKSPFSGIQEGQALIDQGRFAEARARFEEVLPDMDPHQQAQLHALIGNTHFEEQSYAEARREYETALPGLSPDEELSIRLRLGDVYAQLGEHDKARAAYEETLEGVGPEGRAQVLLAIARSYDLQGNRDQAIATVDRILGTEPENVQALQLIADLLSRSGREKEAQAYLDRVPETEELPADMLLNQGVRFYNDDDYDQALANFERVIRQEPDLADAYYYRGRVYLSQSRNAEALADFKKHLELAPDSEFRAELTEFIEYLEAEGG
ncbi:MAG TPA: tetratricopeptide repeat protein [Thermoanaerobaculia bacterium]|nr:tetratricopeptide repeat protein [Thermoanaerobaculia bacterium]